MGAFLRAVNGVKSIKIKRNIDKYDMTRYRYMLANVFTRLDKYFTENNLYRLNNYDKTMDDLLINKVYTFMVSNDLSSGHWGKFTRQTMESGGVIKLNRDIFYDEEKAEGVLCHEVIHMITTGLNYIEYREPNCRVEIVLPDKANVRAGYKKYIYDDGTSETKILTYNELSYNNFFKEGLTELLMNQMYSREEASYTYTANTHFIQTLNTLVGCSLLDSFKSFLQGDLDIYREYFGKEQYDLLEEYLAEHMKDLDASHSNNSVHLQKAYGLVANKAVEVGIKEGKSISEIMMRLNEVTSKMINVEPATLFENIREPLVNYFKDTISNKDRYVSRVESLIERWCDIKCAYIDSYSNRNINIGYKLQGFSENIGFRFSRYNNSLNLMVVSHGMDMTAFYFPEEVGRKYRIPCRDGIDTLTMYRDSENSVIYTQGDLERRLVFDNKGNIVVYSGTEKIDYGHTYPNKNREIRGKMLKAVHEVIEDTVAKVSRLEYMKELENTPKYERPELAYEVEPIVDVASIGDSN